MKLRCYAGPLSLLISFYSLEAFALCGTSVAGTITYTNEVLYYCDNTNWISTDTGPGTTANLCTVGEAGTFKYVSGQYIFCNGSEWRIMKGAVSSACAAGDAGKLIYQSGKLQGCNGTNWYDAVSLPPTPGGYLVRTKDGVTGNISATVGGTTYTGLAGADAFCYNQLTAYNWKGKTSAGTLTQARIKALMCDGSTCNILQANTVYSFSKANLTNIGGAWITTDGSGKGPGDYASWNTYTYFSTPNSSYWTGRGNTSGSLWANTTSGNHCNNWTDGTASSNGTFGSPSSAASSRFSNATLATCDLSKVLVCIVNP